MSEMEEGPEAHVLSKLERLRSPVARPRSRDILGLIADGGERRRSRRLKGMCVAPRGGRWRRSDDLSVTDGGAGGV